MGLTKTKLFYYFHLNSLDKHAEPVSLGITSSNGKYFYAEFSDTPFSGRDTNLILQGLEEGKPVVLGDYTQIRADKKGVRLALLNWLTQFDYVEFWGDCIWYDGMILDELLGGAFSLPDNVHHIFFDIATLFRARGIDADIDRDAFIDSPMNGGKYTSLNRSQVIEACYIKLYRNGDKYGFML